MLFKHNKVLKKVDDYMFNNLYGGAYSPQASIDRINSQIAELEKMKAQIPTQQMQQPTNLTQNFQIAPNTNQASIRYANSIEEVERDIVIGDTPYFSKDLSVLWIKSAKGDIKAYELTEIVEKDEKDLLIESLQYQLNQLTNTVKEMEQNAKSISTNDIKQEITTDTSIVDEPIGTTVEKVKSSSVSNVSKRKTK